MVMICKQVNVLFHGDSLFLNFAPSKSRDCDKVSEQKIERFDEKAAIKHSSIALSSTCAIKQHKKVGKDY